MSEVDIDARDQNGQTPLHLAVYGCIESLNTQAIKRLLIMGADKKLKDNDEMTAEDIFK